MLLLKEQLSRSEEEKRALSEANRSLKEQLEGLRAKVAELEGIITKKDSEVNEGVRESGGEGVKEKGRR